MSDADRISGAAADPDTTVQCLRVRRENGELAAGDVVLNRYELVKKLGSGAMGVVFLCRDRLSGESFALKMVPPELARDEGVMADILANFRLVHNLHHPNIAGVEFLDRDEYGRYFLIMEYAEGQNLADLLRQSGGTLPLPQVIPLVRQLAAALDYAHAQKVLHRDLKPANVMISDSGAVKLLDFGLASEVRTSLTTLSIPVENTSGTPNYLAPELWRGHYPRPASDQYALAVMTYGMLAGHLPFGSDNLEVLRSAVIQELPEAIDSISPELNQVLLRGMAKNPPERFDSCSAFAAALAAPVPAVPPAGAASASDRVKPAQTENNGPAPASPQPIPGKTPKTRRWKFAAALLGVLVLVLGGLLIVQNTEVSPRQTPSPVLPEPSPAVSSSSRQTGSAFTGTVLLPGDVSLEMVKVAADRFTMSKRDGENDSNEIEHTAVLTKDFYLGKYEVTQAQWQTIMGTTVAQQRDKADREWPLSGEGDRHPMYYISWHEAIEFCEKLNERGLAPKGWRFTLPTETQWEFAARGGNKSRGYKYSGSDNLDSVAWYGGNSESKTHPVGTKSPNELGLYDMSGNVWEWCLDDYQSDSRQAVPEFSRGRDNSGSLRVYRGGGWYGLAVYCRSGSRFGIGPGNRRSDLGFRLALVPEKYQ